MIRGMLARLKKRLPTRPKRRKKRLLAFLHRFSKRPFNVIGFIIMSVITLAAILAEVIASERPLAYAVAGDLRILPGVVDTPIPGILDNTEAIRAVRARGGWVLLPPLPYGPNQTKVEGQVSRLVPPSRHHLLGTDDKGRDVAARMVHGARSALLVGMGSVALYLLLAVFIGAMAGYFGGIADRLALRLIETMTAFPTFFLILVIQGLIGATGVLQLILVIGLTRWTDVATLTRAEVMRVVNEEYVLAAHALGLSNIHVLLRHVMPAAIGPALVAGTFGVGGAILIESTLSFLGFGLPNTTPSWGQLLTDAFHNETAYWLAIYPGLLLFITLISINLVGEGFREALDPDG